MTYRERQRLADIQAAIDAIRFGRYPICEPIRRSAGIRANAGQSQVLPILRLGCGSRCKGMAGGLCPADPGGAGGDDSIEMISCPWTWACASWLYYWPGWASQPVFAGPPRMTITWPPGTFGTSMPPAAMPTLVCGEQVARSSRRIHLTGGL